MGYGDMTPDFCVTASICVVHSQGKQRNQQVSRLHCTQQLKTQYVVVPQSAVSWFFAVHISAIQLQYNCNTRIFSCIAVVLHLCGPLQYNAAIQVFYNLQKTCRLLAAVVEKNLYCSYIAFVWTAAIQQNFCVMLL